MYGFVLDPDDDDNVLISCRSLAFWVHCRPSGRLENVADGIAASGGSGLDSCLIAGIFGNGVLYSRAQTTSEKCPRC
jgi:hypothetical protein